MNRSPYTSLSAPTHRHGASAVAMAILLFCVMLAAVGGAWAQQSLAAMDNYERLRDAMTEAPASGEERAALEAGATEAESNRDDTDDSDGTADPLMTRAIDWDGLRAINPDIIAWIYVPGTSIDYPVVQAPASDPDRYLHTTFDGRVAYPNNEGTIHLDAQNSADGLNAASPVLYGHEQLNGSMFSAWRDNYDPEHLASCNQVYLYTPTTTFHVELFAANIVDATKERLYSDLTVEELQPWLDEKLAESEAVLAHPQNIKQLWTFVTCSYTTWRDQRTLSYGITVDRAPTSS